MTALDFSDKEPALKRGRTAGADTAITNAAFYERLQGQTKKKGVERFGWVALPVGAIAILGVVALTSTPHKSADDVVGAPGQATASAKPAPAMTSAKPAAQLASNDAVEPSKVLPAADVKAKISGSQASASTAAPAPVKVAKAAPARASTEAAIRPAAAAPVQQVPAASQDSAASAPAPVIAAPAPVVSAPAPAAEAAPVEAPAPAAPAADQSPPAATPAQ